MPAARKPLISVVLPVWNAERFLVDSIHSVLTQTFQDFELIIVDDGSTDGSLEIIRSYKDSRVRVFVREHQGLAHALNFGIQQARGDWIARQDADDISLSSRLGLQIRAVEGRPGAVLCYTDVELIGEKGFFPSLERFPKSTGLLALRLCYQRPIARSSLLFDKSSFVAVGGYSTADEYAEDFGLLGRMLSFGDFVSVPRKLVKCRLHSQSISQRARGEQHETARGIAIRHCGDFLRLEVVNAIRAYRTLMQESGSNRLIDWLWLLFCVRRLRWKSLELYGWLVRQTGQRLVGL